MRPLLCLLWIALLSGCSPQEAEAPTPQGNEEQRPSLQIADLERRIHDIVNEARREHGLDAYGWRAVLSRVGRDHSCDMLSRGFFDHVTPEGTTPTERAEQHGVSCRTTDSDGRAFTGVSENLFQTHVYSGYEDWTQGADAWRIYAWQTADDIAVATVEGWLASPPHRRALLDPASLNHGIGVCIGDDDKVMVTQVMC